MYVEVETETGEKYEFNGVDRVGRVPEDSHGDAFVRLEYIVPENTERETYDGETGDSERDDATLSWEPTEGIKKLDIENAYISEVSPSDLADAY